MRADIDEEKIEEAINGCVTKAGEHGTNVGRLGVLLAGFPATVPAATLKLIEACSHCSQRIRTVND